MNERLTMADIGRLAGVSVSTVSRALSDSPAIPAATKARILQIAHEHNYQVNRRAQDFRLGRSRTIATVFPYNGHSDRLISDPFYLEIVAAITDQLTPDDYDMILARVPTFDPAWCRRYIDRVDGIIIVDRGVNDRGVAELQSLNANVVIWGPPIAGQDCVSVGCNSVLGGQTAVSHLASLGRKRFGFIGGDKGMVETSLRLQGYRQGLALAGLPCDDDLILFTDFTPQVAAQATQTLLDRAPDLDALFLCSDFTAVAAMEVIRAGGRRVPDDVSVVGYDDIPLAAYCSPRLTTIRQPIRKAGQLLVQKLFALIDGQSVDDEILPFELIVRDSCGANQAG